MSEELNRRYIDRVADINDRFMAWLDRNGSDWHKEKFFDIENRWETRHIDVHTIMMFNLWSRHS